MGDQLVVSVTSDKFVNKGPGRPRFTEDERAEALMALGCVDRVLVNRYPDAVDLIHHLKPAIYVKGSDYCGVEDEALTREAAAISEVGGDMVFTATRKWSSTELLSGEPREPFADYVDIMRRVESPEAFEQALDVMLEARANQHRLFFIGNGGSAAIASHMALDWQKTARIAAMAFNDAPSLTAIGNDLGYENVYHEQMSFHADDGDILIAISSSGRSANIIKATQFMRASGAPIITLTGFAHDNPLRSLGAINFYVPCDRYRIVENAHLMILHSLLDAASDALR